MKINLTKTEIHRVVMCGYIKKVLKSTTPKVIVDINAPKTVKVYTMTKMTIVLMHLRLVFPIGLPEMHHMIAPYQSIVYPLKLSGARV